MTLVKSSTKRLASFVVVEAFRSSRLFVHLVVVLAACGTASDGLTGTLEHCHVFYAREAFGRLQCPDMCPYQTTCQAESHRSTCISNGSLMLRISGEEQTLPICFWLLPRGQLLETEIIDTANHTVVLRRCLSCNISGCKTCGLADNGTAICEVCEDDFILLHGRCSWNQYTLLYTFYSVLIVVGLLVLWIVIDVTRAELLPVANTRAMKMGFIMRTRAKLFMRDGNSEEHCQFPLSAPLFGRGSVEVAGPGFVLFMNWLLFSMAASFWLMVGAIIFTPFGGEELAYVDLCRQQYLSKGANGHNQLKFRSPAVGADNSGPYKEWACWNYLGLTILSVAFAWWQGHVWASMVTRPKLEHYCVEFSEMPASLTNKREIRQHLNDWLEKLNLGRQTEQEAMGTSRWRPAIRYISVVYDVPRSKEHMQEILIDANIHTAMAKREHAPCAPDSMLHAQCKSENAAQDAGPFWIQVLAFFIFQTPIHLLRRQAVTLNSAEPFSPIAQGEKVDVQHNVNARDFLQTLRGSGYMYVVLDTQALASAVAAVGKAKLGDHHVKVRRATLAPEMVRWQDYAPVPHTIMLARVCKAALVLLIAFILWLLFFGWYLNFEIAFEDLTFMSKDFMGTFVVGLLVPIGNAIIGACIDAQTEAIGFRDEDRMRLWRIILNVLINALANFGEVYLVFRKVYTDETWKVSSMPWMFWKMFQPIHANPNVLQFQEQLLAILFPAGLLVPIFTIPLLQNFLPWLVGHLRVKRDTRISESEAERIMRPCDVDLNSSYSDIIINLLLVSYTFWISPGRYHIYLWLAVFLWALLLSLSFRMNVLRWQARSYFGSKDPHVATLYLLALPLGIFGAALEVQLFPSYMGWHAISWHLAVHFVFVRHLVRRFKAKNVSDATYDQIMEGEFAPIANYLNANPIEVLKSNHMPEESEPGFEEMIFYRPDKWYLQEQSLKFHSEISMESSVHISVLGQSVLEARSLPKEAVLGTDERNLPTTNLVKEAPAITQHSATMPAGVSAHGRAIGRSSSGLDRNPDEAKPEDME